MNLSYVFLFVVVLVMIPELSFSVNTLTSTESLTISSKQTIVSPGNIFELGFFKPVTTSRWYLGIWYKKIPNRTYVWVANRDNPLSNSSGTLKIFDANLLLLDHSDNPVWSTNLTRRNVKSPVVAELLDNGNFVMRYSNNNNPDRILWQSFDFPTDTLLPEMKLGKDLKTGLNRFLRSWRSLNDPSSGDYLYKLETRGFPEFFLLVNDYQGHRSGPWNGLGFSGMPELRHLNYMVYKFAENTEEIAYTFLMTNHSIYSRLTMSLSGYLQRFTCISPDWGWTLIWSSPTDQCDTYQTCGPYAYCDANTSPECNCIKGFDPRNLQEWVLADGSSGCVRRTPLSCGQDRFIRLKSIKLPDTRAAIVDRRIDLKECKKKCFRDCNCTAFANADIRNGGSGCVIWTGVLVDIRNYAAGGQDLFVKLAAADLEEKKNLSRKMIGLIIGVSLTLLLSFIIFFCWKRKQKQERRKRRERERPSSTYNVDISHDDRSDALLIHDSHSSSNTTPTTSTTPPTTNATQSSKDEVLDIDFELPLIDFTTIAKATNYFSDSNKLGQGGYGIVYKQGRLPHGQDIAVKRLSVTSKQGIVEFKNEIKLIARLQHVNLVRLLACCVDQDEKILIYEYLENRSLDSFVFDEALSFKLDWETRFEIINGMARGLLYLHQDSRFRIIHRDFKTSNILLDKNMTPKISDFGMARIFACDTTEANTARIVGTYGYMAPEYGLGGIYSTKSDVYSFGVTLIEIICGRKNKIILNSGDEQTLIGSVYYSWEQGTELEVIDPLLLDSVLSFQKIKRCLQIGLLCVQKHAFDRPAMSFVVMMLASEIPLPVPNHPDFFFGQNPYDKTDATPTVPFLTEEFSTVNEVTVSTVQPR